jgi:hypothetical protein
VPSFQDDPLFDPYRVLGVSILADQEEIRHAYRILAHRFHPDTNAEDPGATHRFAEATGRGRRTGRASRPSLPLVGSRSRIPSRSPEPSSGSPCSDSSC